MKHLEDEAKDQAATRKETAAAAAADAAAAAVEIGFGLSSEETTAAAADAGADVAAADAAAAAAAAAATDGNRSAATAIGADNVASAMNPAETGFEYDYLATAVADASAADQVSHLRDQEEHDGSSASAETAEAIAGQEVALAADSVQAQSSSHLPVVVHVMSQPRERVIRHRLRVHDHEIDADNSSRSSISGSRIAGESKRRPEQGVRHRLMSSSSSSSSSMSSFASALRPDDQYDYEGKRGEGEKEGGKEERRRIEDQFEILIPSSDQPQDPDQPDDDDDGHGDHADDDARTARGRLPPSLPAAHTSSSATASSRSASSSPAHVHAVMLRDRNLNAASDSGISGGQSLRQLFLRLPLISSSSHDLLDPLPVPVIRSAAYSRRNGLTPASSRTSSNSLDQRDSSSSDSEDVIIVDGERKDHRRRRRLLQESSSDKVLSSVVAAATTTAPSSDDEESWRKMRIQTTASPSLPFHVRRQIDPHIRLILDQDALALFLTSHRLIAKSPIRRVRPQKWHRLRYIDLFPGDAVAVGKPAAAKQPGTGVALQMRQATTAASPAAAPQLTSPSARQPSRQTSRTSSVKQTQEQQQQQQQPADAGSWWKLEGTTGAGGGSGNVDRVKGNRSQRHRHRRPAQQQLDAHWSNLIS